MQNSVLFRRSSFFVDASNVIFYTDLFLYHELSKRMTEVEFLSDVFGDKFPTFQADNRGELDKLIVKATANKIHQNILLDWISEDKFIKANIDMPMGEYVAFLYMDMLTYPTCDEYLQTTELGNTLKLISTDKQLNRMVIHIPFDSDFLKEAISEFISGTTDGDFQILIGDKTNFLKKNKFDSYILENVTDVDEYLAISENRPAPNSQFIKEILVPTYEFNMEEGRTNLDMLVEQITYHKLKLKKTSNEYVSEFHFSINTISVPI